MEMNLTPRKYMLGASLPAGLEEREMRQAEQAVRDAVKAVLDRRNDVTNLVFSGYPPEMAERIAASPLFDTDTFLRIVGPYWERVDYLAARGYPGVTVRTEW